jgi:hypothetical protein
VSRNDDKVGILRDFIGQIRVFEEQLTDVLDKNPTDSQIRRLALCQDAVARTRRQVGWLIYELVVGWVGWEDRLKEMENWKGSAGES